MATVNISSFPTTVSVSCTKCATAITVYDPASSEYVVCPKCYAYIHLKENERPFIKQMAVAPESTPVIPLGTEGVFRELPYKVIGYLEKKEVGTYYYWREYLLYNYTKGYAFLAEYEGHWSFIAGKDHFPDLSEASYPNNNVVTFRDNDFSVYNKYEPAITALLGEYDWDVLNELVYTREWIMPPYLLVNEKNLRNKTQNDWYLGEYAEPKEVAAAFGLTVSDLPSRTGIGANQRSPYLRHWQQSSRIVPFFMLAVLMLGLLHAWLYPAKVVLSSDYQISLSDKGLKDALHADSSYISNGEYEYKPFTSTSFKLDNTTALEFDINANIDNNWTEATVLLANEQTNQTWEVTKSIEYYHGYEDGESWSEGSSTENILLSHIPAGRYHLNIYPYSGDKAGKNISITVSENDILWRNVIVTILLLALYPLFFWIMTYYFEKRRWANSDYSPYQHGEDNDD